MTAAAVQSQVTGDIRCQSAASKLVIQYTQQDAVAAAAAAAAVASGTQLAIPVAIDLGRPDETARPDYHAYCGCRRPRWMMDGKET